MNKKRLLGFMIITLFTVGMTVPLKAKTVDNLKIQEPTRIRVADVIASHDDLYYNGGWEVRENYIHTVIFYNVSFSFSGYTYQDVTSTADRNAGLTRIRTYYHYNIN
ncbi:MAG: hypothetical protein VB009_08150 [Erysipelotrichaceae bacterium]|nr:hypothetical protein [Erysipelotrichaceae bacterium]